ncbi:FecR family protein [Pedobacter polaris]|uniref:FecR family protein n=1 Tax=Pedobacter polaris TaxID=2571273 RepID=A0A4U1CJG2_9SPHI|nr:FecR family protein [Pedobacter polaris]TKC05493.1 FecR family protein [Pedobacter polaris]
MIPFKNKKDLESIIKNYVSGKATAEEIKFIEAYYQYLGKGSDILAEKTKEELDALATENYKTIQAKITQSKTKRKIIPLYRYAAAAVVLISLSIGAFYTITVNNKKTLVATKELAKKNDVLPGVDKAILTLADGSRIVLDNHTSGNISEKAGVTISKTGDGQLLYKINAKSDIKSAAIAYNTIETPKGGQYQVILPDGTKVWLNAASSLKYPEIFAGNERKVELTGEAYFEVAKNKALPFRVMSKNQEIEVLGTHFNVNTYMDDKSIKTTLLEGSIKISNQKSVKILKPGEQAVIQNYGLAAINILANVDTDDETAWKNGQFRFNNANLKTILNQLERWYDIKIDYSTVPEKRYNGMVPRKAKLSEVLSMLELTGNISFEILEGRKLKVYTKK